MRNKPKKPWFLDLFQLEYAAVRIRNRLHFHLTPKRNPEAKKYFVVGHPRTGTQTLHRLFVANGLRGYHSAGNWKLRDYDAFSDRGDYQPYELLDKHFPNAFFILNTRPSFNYFRSRMNRVVGNLTVKSLPKPRFTVDNVRHAIIARNDHFFQVLEHFLDRQNFIVANIERQGALQFICDATGLEYPGEIISNHKADVHLDEEMVSRIEEAFESLGIHDQRMNPFIIPELLDDDRRARYEDAKPRMSSSCFL